MDSRSSSSVSASTPPLPLKLDRANYIFWRAQVLPTIRAHSFYEFLSPTAIPPSSSLPATSGASPRPNLAYAAWIRMDRFLVRWILEIPMPPVKKICSETGGKQAESSDDAMAGILPSNIIISILSRLPVKYIYRFRVEHFATPNFIKLHYGQFSQTQLEFCRSAKRVLSSTSSSKSNEHTANLIVNSLINSPQKALHISKLNPHITHHILSNPRFPGSSCLRFFKFLKANHSIAPQKPDLKIFRVYAEMGHLKICEILIEDVGVQIDPITYREDTPLIVAAKEGHIRAVKCLVKIGAGVHMSNSKMDSWITATKTSGYDFNVCHILWFDVKIRGFKMVRWLTMIARGHCWIGRALSLYGANKEKRKDLESGCLMPITVGLLRLMWRNACITNCAESAQLGHVGKVVKRATVSLLHFT